MVGNSEATLYNGHISVNRDRKEVSAMQAKHRLYSSAIGMLAGAIALLTNSTIGVAVLLITGAMFLRSFYDSSRADRM